MKSSIRYYQVETPAGLSMTWLGGPTKLAGPGKVWLTNLDGEPLLLVDARCVRKITREELAHRLAEDARSAARERQAALSRN